MNTTWSNSSGIALRPAVMAASCLFLLLGAVGQAHAYATGSMAQALPAGGAVVVDNGSGSGSQLGVGAFGNFGYAFGNPWDTPTHAAVDSSAGASHGAAAAATEVGRISMSAAAVSGARTPNSGTVSAANGYWNDGFVIAADAEHPRDSVGTLAGVLHVAGMLTMPCPALNDVGLCGIFNEQNFFRTNVVASVKLQTTAGSTTVTGGAGASGDFSHGASFSQVAADGTVSFDLPFTVAFRFGGFNALSVFAQTEAVSGSFGSLPGSAVAADFSSGITWGGMSIRDAQGRLMGGAGLVSDSGFNYADAAVSSVPEPGSPPMLLAGLGVLLCGAHRRRMGARLADTSV